MTDPNLTLAIEGMTCENCATTIQRSLLNERGVREAHIDWASGTGRIVVDPDVTDATRVLQSSVFHEQSGMHRFTASLSVRPNRRTQ